MIRSSILQPHELNGIRTTILDRLFEPLARRHEMAIEALIDKNDQLLGIKNGGFHYPKTDCYYRREKYPPYLWDDEFPTLVEALHPEMEKILQRGNQTYDDKQEIAFVLHKLFQNCHSICDVRDALPECLVGLHGWLQDWKRTRPEAWSIRDDPRALRAYQKALSKIEMIAALRLIY